MQGFCSYAATRVRLGCGVTVYKQKKETSSVSL